MIGRLGPPSNELCMSPGNSRNTTSLIFQQPNNESLQNNPYCTTKLDISTKTKVPDEQSCLSNEHHNDHCMSPGNCDNTSLIFQQPNNGVKEINEILQNNCKIKLDISTKTKVLYEQLCLNNEQHKKVPLCLKTKNKANNKVVVTCCPVDTIKS